jgi:hypothetical protein
MKQGLKQIPQKKHPRIESITNIVYVCKFICSSIIFNVHLLWTLAQYIAL